MKSPLPDPYEKNLLLLRLIVWKIRSCRPLRQIMTGKLAA